jgi:hypothetical protein
MARIFLSVVEFIKQREFEVWAPEFYHPFIPQDIVNPPVVKRERANPYRMVGD